MDGKKQQTALTGLTLDEISALFAALDPPLEPLRARQVFERIIKNFDNFEVMTELPPVLRSELSLGFTLRTTHLENVFSDDDRTIKLRIHAADNAIVEAVIMKDGFYRHTACISSQAGCPMGCVFCATGNLGFSRNLNAAEIIEQVYHIRNVMAGIPELQKKKEGEENKEKFDNLVFMGMGEPLLNLEAVRKACAILCGDENERRFSPRRITISTCGLAEKIREFAQNGPAVRLAVSLTSAREELRRRLMPGADSLDALKSALLEYQKLTGHRITLAMTLFRGINTGQNETAAVAKFAEGLSVMVNLIPWNPVLSENGKGTIEFDGVPLLTPSDKEVKRFRKSLEHIKINAVLRRAKGVSVHAACGQLGQITPQK